MNQTPLAVIALTALATSAFAATPPEPVAVGHPASEEAAVLATLDRYFAAISADDFATMTALQMPDGKTYRARAVPGEAMEVVVRPNSYWTDPARKDGHTSRERYWSPTVMVRGSIALAWAPYEFWVDGASGRRNAMSALIAARQSPFFSSAARSANGVCVAPADGVPSPVSGRVSSWRWCSLS